MDIMKMGKNPNYLGSWDIEDIPGKELVLTIADIKDEKVVANGREEACTVCYFTNNQYKPMILNVTNKKTLAKLYKTKESEKLKGKAITIGIEKVKAFGDIHDALRIKKTIPTVTQTKSIKCEKCGQDIVATSGMSVEQIADYTKKKYGICLCGKCATEKAKAVQG